LERRTQELTDARNEIGRELGEARLNAESQSNAARQEKVRSEKLLEELALAKKKLANVEAENANLAAEAQRLTDALHAQTVGPDAAHHDEDDYVADETGVAETTLPPEAASPAGEEMKAPAAAQVRRDSVGRPVENALEDIEDLIASSVPPSPTRR
jgi:seryl-tRNA synthetase